MGQMLPLHALKENQSKARRRNPAYTRLVHMVKVREHRLKMMRNGATQFSQSMGGGNQTTLNNDLSKCNSTNRFDKEVHTINTAEGQFDDGDFYQTGNWGTSSPRAHVRQIKRMGDILKATEEPPPLFSTVKAKIREVKKLPNVTEYYKSDDIDKLAPQDRMNKKSLESQESLGVFMNNMRNLRHMENLEQGCRSNNKTTRLFYRRMLHFREKEKERSVAETNRISTAGLQRNESRATDRSYDMSSESTSRYRNRSSRNRYKSRSGVNGGFHRRPHSTAFGSRNASPIPRTATVKRFTAESILGIIDACRRFNKSQRRDEELLDKLLERIKIDTDLTMRDKIEVLFDPHNISRMNFNDVDLLRGEMENKHSYRLRENKRQVKIYKQALDYLKNTNDVPCGGLMEMMIALRYLLEGGWNLDTESFLELLYGYDLTEIEHDPFNTVIEILQEGFGLNKATINAWKEEQMRSITLTAKLGENFMPSDTRRSSPNKAKNPVRGRLLENFP